MWIRAALLTGLTAASISCTTPIQSVGGDTTLPLREQLQITPQSPNVPLDQTTLVKLASRDGWYKVQIPVVWTSSKPEVITVRGAGEEASLRGMRTGWAIITATDAGGATATARAHVRFPDD